MYKYNTLYKKDFFFVFPWPINILFFYFLLPFYWSSEKCINIITYINTWTFSRFALAFQNFRWFSFQFYDVVHIFIICRNKTIMVLTSVILLVNTCHCFVFIVMLNLLAMKWQKSVRLIIHMNEPSCLLFGLLVWYGLFLYLPCIPFCLI